MERTKLLDEVVSLDARIIAITTLAARTPNDREFDRLIKEVAELRKIRLTLQAKLDAMGK